MTVEPNGFMEYLQLQDSSPELVTKSELLSEVRELGYSIGERQLSFYVSEQIIPKSVRVGSRAGAYPRIVVQLLAWVLGSRDRGLQIDTIKELLPIWKFLITVRSRQVLDLKELEYLAQLHITSIEASIAVPGMVGEVLHACDRCLGCENNHAIQVLRKDGQYRSLNDEATTIGFAVARRIEPDADHPDEPVHSIWFARTRISLAKGPDPLEDDGAVILGLKSGDPLPVLRKRKLPKGVKR